jgi:hypothetical protein
VRICRGVCEVAGERRALRDHRIGGDCRRFGHSKSRVPKRKRAPTWPAYECLERLVVVAPLWLRDRVRLLMPAVALREPLAKAVLTSWRSGAQSATTRIP